MLSLSQKLALFAGLSVSGCGSATGLRETPLTTVAVDVPTRDVATATDASCGQPAPCTPQASNLACANPGATCPLECPNCASGSCRLAPDGCYRWQPFLGGGPLAPPELQGS